MNYQLLPDMTDEQYAALKADIADRGVMIPIEYDESGNLLDGHHRLKACTELGITDIPTIVRHFSTEEEKRYHVRAVNANRRQLTQEQRRQIIIAQLKDAPQKSDRRIATELGVSDKTVGAQREILETRAEIPHLNISVGADGKEYPRQVERKPIETDNIGQSVQCNEIADPLDSDEPTAVKILDFSEKEPINHKIVNVQDRQWQEYDDFDKKLELGHDNFKKLARIFDAVDKFEATDETIQTMMWCFDDLVTLDDQIKYIDETIYKLQNIKLKLMKGKKNEKGKYSSYLC